MRPMRPLLLLCLLALLTACAPPAAPTQPTAPAAANSPDAATAPAAPTFSGEPVTITFALDDFARGWFEPLAERFMAEQSNITVQLVSMPEQIIGADGSFDPIAYQRQIAEAADSSFGWRPGADSVRQGLVLNLQPLIDADPSFEQGDYLSGALAVNDGVLAHLPSFVSVGLYAYDRQRFSERGVAEPTPDLSFAQLLERAQQVAQPGDAESAVYGIWSERIAFDALLLQLQQAGIDLGPASGTPPPLSDERYAAALAQVQALATTNTILYESPARRSTLSNDNRSWQLIEQGRVAIWPALDFDTDSVLNRVGFLPIRDPLSGQPNFSSSMGLSISAGTQHPEAAWRWLSFLSRQYIEQTDSSFGFLPPRRSLLEQHWQSVSQAERATIEPLLDGLQPRPWPTPNQERFATLTALSGALDQVLDQNQPIPQALAAAELVAQEELARAVAPAATPTPDTRPAVVNTPVASSAAAGAQPVRFGVAPSFAAAVRVAAERFNREQSAVAVTVEAIDASGDFVPASLAAQFDCFAASAGSSAAMAAQNLQPLLDADPTFDRADYPPVLLEQMRQDGRLAGLPLTMDVPLLIYNRELFAAAGVAPPAANWTLDDFVATAEQLSGGTGAERRYGLAGVDPGLLFFVLERSGANPLSADGQRPQFTDPAVEAAIQRFVELVERAAPSQRLSSYSANPGDPAATEAIQGGRVAMWLGSTSSAPFADGALPVALAPVPLADGRLPGVAVNQALFISAINQQPEACWQWFAALSRDAEVGNGGELPARLSLLNAAAERPSARPGTAELVAAYEEALAAALPLGATPAERTPFNSFWLLRAVDRALQGGDLEQELADAQFVTEQHLACVQSGERAGVCARQVDPTYDGWDQ